MSSRTNLSSNSSRAAKWREDLHEAANRLWDDGLTYKEISVQLGISVAAVKAKVRGRPRRR